MRHGKACRAKVWSGFAATTCATGKHVRAKVWSGFAATTCAAGKHVAQKCGAVLRQRHAPQESMSRKSVERFCGNDMRHGKHVAQKCGAVLRQRHAPQESMSRKSAERFCGNDMRRGKASRAKVWNGFAATTSRAINASFKASPHSHGKSAEFLKNRFW
jgi:hypothetical protein